MVKKIQCRVIASAAPGNRNAANDEMFTEDNPVVSNFPIPLRPEMLTYTNRSGTAKVNRDNSHAGKLLDLFF